MRTSIGMAILVGLALAGCSNSEGKLLAKGRILKGGENLLPNREEGEYIAVTFVPIRPDGKPPDRFYYGAVDQDEGTFMASGPDKKGVPPGKYRVAVELMKKKKDQFNGRFDPAVSPFVFDIDAETEEILVDLDDPPAPAGRATRAVSVEEANAASAG